MRIYNFNTGEYPFDQYFKKLYDIDSLESIHTLHNSSVVFDMQNNSEYFTVTLKGKIVILSTFMMNF